LQCWSSNYFVFIVLFYIKLSRWELSYVIGWLLCVSCSWPIWLQLWRICYVCLIGVVSHDKEVELNHSILPCKYLVVLSVGVENQFMPINACLKRATFCINFGQKTLDLGIWFGFSSDLGKPNIWSFGPLGRKTNSGRHPTVCGCAIKQQMELLRYYCQNSHHCRKAVISLSFTVLAKE